MLGTIILGILLGGEPLTGYELRKIIQKGVGVFYRASYGSLYPALEKLEKRGHVTVEERHQGGRRKNYYTITESGAALFRAWLVAPMEAADNPNTHLAKVYFFDRLPPEDARKQLLDYEENNRRALEELRALEQDFAAREGMEAHYYKLATLYYGILMTEETLRWCRHIRERAPLADLNGAGPQHTTGGN